MRKIILILLVGMMFYTGSAYAWPWQKTDKKQKEPKVKVTAHIEIEKPKKPRGEGKIKFIDEKGKVIKEIWIGKKVIYIGKEKKRKKIIIVEGNVSKDGKYAVIIGEQSVERELPNYEILSFLDNRGNILWKKKFPCSDHSGISKPLLSENGKTIVIAESDSYEPMRIYVYNNKGNRILEFPKSDEKYIFIDGYKLSPNGRYLGINTAQKSPRKSTTVFFDLETGKFWDSHERCFIKNITNRGKVKVGFQTKYWMINLKDKFSNS